MLQKIYSFFVKFYGLYIFAEFTGWRWHPSGPERANVPTRSGAREFQSNPQLSRKTRLWQKLLREWKKQEGRVESTSSGRWWRVRSKTRIQKIKRNTCKCQTPSGDSCSEESVEQCSWLVCGTSPHRAAAAGDDVAASCYRRRFPRNWWRHPAGERNSEIIG